MNVFKSILAIVLTAVICCIVVVTDSFAQTDSVVVKAEHGIPPANATSDACGFYVTVKNRNAAGSSIDAVVFTMQTLDNTVFAAPTNPQAPTGWDNLLSLDNLTDSMVARANVLAAGKDLAGFKINYTNDGTHEYDVPKMVKWTTYSNGSVVSSGTINPICVFFQANSSFDTATALTQLSGGDPCFFFTVTNRNSNGAQIGHLQFQLLNPSSGFIRPSKVVPPTFWVTDSVTANSAYFHTDANFIGPGNSKAPFQVCLRSNTTIPKHSFVYWCLDDQGSLIDRDTLFNIPIQGTSAVTDADSVSVNVASGCAYTLTLKNYHVTNLIPPGPITKLVLRTQTVGVQFDAAPNAPANWTKTVTADSIVYAADITDHAIPGGIVSTDFSYSVKGTTTTPFTIGWQTFRPQGSISTGQFTTQCTVQGPRGDSVTIGPGGNACDFVMHVINLHNTPASNISSVVLSIPTGTGELFGVASSSGWDFATVPGTGSTQVKFSSTTSPLTTGSAQDLTVQLVPKTSGTNVALSWQTNDESSSKISNGQVTINCTPVATPCDTVTRTTVQPLDSCINNFAVQSRGNANIVSVKLASQIPGWTITWAVAPPNWKDSIDPAKSFVLFTTGAEGIAPGASLGNFDVRFDGAGAATDSPLVVATTTDLNGRSCMTQIQFLCSSTSGSVIYDPNKDDPNLTNVTLVPNPASLSSDLHLTIGKEERLYVTVFDALGRTVWIAANQTYGAGMFTIPLNVASQPAGSYYVRIETPYGLITKRLVKQ